MRKNIIKTAEKLAEAYLKRLFERLCAFGIFG